MPTIEPSEVRMSQASGMANTVLVRFPGSSMSCEAAVQREQLRFIQNVIDRTGTPGRGCIKRINDGENVSVYFTAISAEDAAAVLDELCELYRFSSPMLAR